MEYYAAIKIFGDFYHLLKRNDGRYILKETGYSFSLKTDVYIHQATKLVSALLSVSIST